MSSKQLTVGTSWYKFVVFVASIWSLAPPAAFEPDLEGDFNMTGANGGASQWFIA
jgi:hypothetical protein